MKKYLLGITLFGAVIGVKSQDVTSGLVAKYTFDNQDVSADVGVVNGVSDGCSFSAGYNGLGNSISLSGHNDNQIASIPDGIVAVTSDFTVSFWFKADSINNNQFQYMLCSRHDNAGNEQGGFDFIIDKASEKIVATGRRGSPFADITSLTSSTTVQEGQWYHIVLTRNTYTMNLYVNGNLEATDDIDYMNGEYLSDPGYWSIGAMINPGPVIVRELWGSVDEIRFYDRGITSVEVSNLYNYELTVGVNENDENTLLVYPNPAKDIIYIESSKHQMISVQILDLTGKEITFSYESRIDVSNLPTGTYIVKVQTQKGSTTSRFIKL